jgi:hypothetical protein
VVLVANTVVVLVREMVVWGYVMTNVVVGGGAAREQAEEMTAESH